MILIIMFSYDTKDPSFRSSTSDNINNLLGSFGSNIADPLHLSLGISYLVIVLILVIWSWRLIFNINKEKILSRVFYTNTYCNNIHFFSTYPPSDDWVFSYGMGGIFGDTILIFILENTKFEINETLRVYFFNFWYSFLIFICIISAINKKNFIKLQIHFFHLL